MNSENEELGGQASQEPPCIYLDENGKHLWNIWHYTHKPGYKFWIPLCPHCGYVDTDGILKEIEEKGLNTRSKQPTGKLVELNVQDVNNELVKNISWKPNRRNINSPIAEVNVQIILRCARAICAKFGSPAQGIKEPDQTKDT